MKALRIIATVLLICMLSALFAACDNNTPDPTEVPTDAPTDKPTEKPTEAPTNPDDDDDDNNNSGNVGDDNIGDDNTGDNNTGDDNTGNDNTGDDNTGDDNTGDNNTGDDNTGDDNTGDDNTGDDNTGDDNTGDDNTGDDNTGDDNTGDDNTGDDNTGDDNTGDDNTGDDNTGDDNTGDDNTDEDTPDYFAQGIIKIGDTSISEYKVVTPKNAGDAITSNVNAFVEWVKEITGHTLTVVNDSTAETDHEILFGMTNRPESSSAMDYNVITTSNDFNVVLSGDKLAIMALTKSGYNSAVSSFKGFAKYSKGVITSGFTTNRLDYDKINELVIGAIRHEITSSGLRLHKATQSQIDAWKVHSKNWSVNKDCPEQGVGIRLDFDTNATFFTFGVSGGSCVVLVNNEVVARGVSTGTYDLDTTKESNRVTIILPTGNTKNWTITSLIVDAGATVTRHKTDLNVLFLGDSITQGYNNHGHPDMTYTFYTSQYFNADSVVQGHGGSQIWVDMLDSELSGLYQPDLIFIALGTNDYANGCRADELQSRMNAFLDKLQQIYPNAKIVGITPIKRFTDSSMTAFDTNLAASNDGLERAFTAHGCFIVDGETLLSEKSEYADYVHPNENGFLVYGENLCNAVEDLVEEIIANKNN